MLTSEQLPRTFYRWNYFKMVVFLSRKIGISQEFQYAEILQKEEQDELDEDEEEKEEEEKWEEEETEKEARRRAKEQLEREFENLEFPPKRGTERGGQESRHCTCYKKEGRRKKEDERVEFEKADFAQIGAKLRALSISMSHLPQKKEERRGKTPICCNIG
jgi:hypothetical protein